MSYDINEYTDDQCFEMLDLNNPSDRELEMKILQQMDKYERKSKRLYQFFEQMYDRFFADDEDEEDVIEGFASDATFQYDGKPIPKPTAEPKVVNDVKQYTIDKNNQIIVNQQIQQPPQGMGGAAQNIDLPNDVKPEGNVFIKKIDKDVVAKAASSDTRLVDYVKDPLKLNPTSQKTIFKMISIDSQYREDSQNTSATNFSLNLSEDLRNVISMKLYSVQIPYTWYTINNNFGSNYFFLKGNSPGIDNGQHDVKVQIRSGTYTPGQIATAINTSIDTLKSKNITNPQYHSIYDLSFGQTYISYNTANSQSSKIAFEFDLNKTFNETDYALYFPNWTSPNVIGGAKSDSIPSFLGYNYNTYLPYIAYSDARATYFDTNPNFILVDNLNNYFQVVQYTGSSYANLASTHKTINITLNAGTYPRNTLITSFNNAIKSANKIDSIYSYFQLTTITDPANINYGKKRIELATKLNRATTEQIVSSKLAIVFPDESTINSNAKIWTGNSSCFRFPSNTIELNNVISETPTSVTNYYIPNDTDIILTCIRTGYDISYNNFKTSLTIGGYILDDYAKKINDSLQNFIDLSNNLAITDGTIIQNGTEFYFEDSFPTFSFDISRNFTEQQHIIDLTQSFLNRGNIFQFHALYSNIYTDIRVIGSQASYEINDDNNIIRIIAKNSGNGFTDSSGNYNANDIIITLTHVSTTNLTEFCENVTESFTNSVIMAGSSIIATGLTITLVLKVNVTLTEKDYEVSFVGDTWNNNFGLSVNPYQYPLSTSSIITGTKSIFNNLITLSTLNNNNQIIFRPVNPVLTGGNDIIFEIPSTTYTREQLITQINTLFYQNPITRNSTITVDNNNISTIKMTINKTYTSADFRLVFYDIFSFVYCNVGVSNVRNVKWDTTLGWILGFHTYTEYNLSEFAKLGTGQISSDIFNEKYQNYFNNIYGRITAPDSPTDPGDPRNTGNTNSIVNQANYTNSNSSDGRLAIIGDSVCNTNLYNYFLLIIDDFIQNHVNDGLITIASVENDIALPTNVSRISYQCDPITGQKIAGISTNNQFTSLTAKQLYSMNQIIDARRSSSTYTAGPYMRDVFGLIPIKLAGLSFGSTYMEFGGTLQNQNRKYFGPVNIKKMSIKLINDRGDVVDLNGTNWSFTLICEILNTAI